MKNKPPCIGCVHEHESKASFFICIECDAVKQWDISINNSFETAPYSDQDNLSYKLHKE